MKKSQRQKNREKLARIVKQVMAKKRGFTSYPPVNIYATARIGSGVNVGMFSEIGHNVEIGENTRIGYGCFICELVHIGKNCFLGPRVTFCNDRRPMSHRDLWEHTFVADGARLGAAVTVLPGVRIGRNALVGAGSVVTRDIPDGETWAGVPARKMNKQ